VVGFFIAAATFSRRQTMAWNDDTSPADLENALKQNRVKDANALVEELLTSTANHNC
jgi:hypothetical protein